MLDEIKAPIATELEEAEAEFRSLVRSKVPLINDIIDHVAIHKGKRLRPILLLLCSGAAGGISSDSIRAAAMVELLHTATLIHDDVIDESAMRRGGPSINSLWGNRASILIGDLFFSRVLSRLAEIRNPEVTAMMSMTIKWVCEGELIQLENGLRQKAVDEDIYFNLIAKKTASLLAAACELGVISSSSNTNGKDRSRFGKFGEQLGIAFQIRDDVMDLVGAQMRLGKPVANDIKGNTLTLPLLYGLRNCSDGDRVKIEALLEAGVRDTDVEEISRFVLDSGGIAYAEDKANQHIDVALSFLEGYENTIYKRSLVKLAEFTVGRGN